MKTQKHTPSVATIFGITGDLAAKKILPSLWHLHTEGRLPEKFVLIGYGRRPLSEDDFRELVHTSIEKGSHEPIQDESFDEFFSMMRYQIGTFEDLDGYKGLASQIVQIESDWGVCANKLYYLSVPPSSYEPIFKGLAGEKLNKACGTEGTGWTRILIEKPFGYDLQSARSLLTQLQTYFTREQIYPIDHYLFKEMIQGIKDFRFSNSLFEETWNTEYIEKIDIRLYESIGVENRGSFYDGVGAMRDVVQNHLLMMLAAITMEKPDFDKKTTESIRTKRAEILSTLLPWTRELLSKHTYRAQYQGYKEILGVAENSHTETYASVHTELTNSRWAGVPITLEAGKRMGEARKEIVVTFKGGANEIVFRLEPENEIVIHFKAKKPGFDDVLENRTFIFLLYEKVSRVPYVEEYAKILYAAMIGEQSLFVSPEEIETLWKFTDPIVQAWQDNLVPLESYEPDTVPSNTSID